MVQAFSTTAAKGALWLGVSLGLEGKKKSTEVIRVEVRGADGLSKSEPYVNRESLPTCSRTLMDCFVLLSTHSVPSGAVAGCDRFLLTSDSLGDVIAF